jgi:hypothetical protein
MEEVCELTSRYHQYLAAVILVVIGIAVPALAQDERGWNFSGRFSGSSNSAGIILKADPAVGYSFNRHFETYAGLPFYFAKESSTATATTPTTTSNGFMNGIGNAYIGFRLGADNPSVNFASNLVATAPTGDKDKGFSTGRATVDWTNSLSRSFSSVTPFANIGLANTVSDTAFFVRPFTSLGVVTHFDGGAKLRLSQYANVGASAYAVRAAGQQTIISKIVPRKSTAAAPAPASSSPSKGNGNAKSQVFETTSETVGSADLANDHGFSGWLSVFPQSGIDFQIGYTRSVGYDLDTLFFGVGFRFGK